MHKPQFKRLSAGMLAASALVVSSVLYAGSAMATGQGTEPVAQGGVSESSARAGDGKSYRTERRRGHHHGHKNGHRYGRHMADAGLILPGYGPVPQDVVASLALNAQQQALVDDAKSFVREQHQAWRDQARNARKGAAGKSASTALDPHARVKLRDERLAAMQKVRAEGTQKWLAVWDALDASQQDTLAAYIAQRNDERAQRREKWREKRAARNAGSGAPASTD